MTADITLRGPGDVVAVLPYQLGYHPRDSVVAVSLRGPAGRASSPAPTCRRRSTTGAVVARLIGPLLRDGATSVIVVGYEDEPDASQPSAHRARRAARAGRDRRRSTSPWCATAGATRRPAPSRAAHPRAWRCPTRPTCPAVAEFVALDARRWGPATPSRTWSSPTPVGVRGSRMPSRPVPDAAPSPTSRGGLAARPATRAACSSPGCRAGPTWRAQAVADAALGLADIPWRDGLVAWLAPGVLPLEAVDRDVVALMRTTLPTWAGMGVAVPATPRTRGASTTTQPRRIPTMQPTRPADDRVGRPRARTTSRSRRGHGRPARSSPIPDGTGRPPDVPGGGVARPPRSAGWLGPRVVASAGTCSSACWPCAGPCPTSARRRRPRCAPWRRTSPGSVATAPSHGRRSTAPLRLVPDYRLALLLERLVDTGLRLPRPARPGATTRGGRAGPSDDEARWGRRAGCVGTGPSARSAPRVAGCVTGRRNGPARRERLGTMDAGHESQCQTPVCWAATLLAVGCPG